MSNVLQVKLYQVSGSSTYYSLRAEKVTHSLSRNPSQIGIPSELISTAPSVITLDLGVCVENITVSGLVNSVSTGTGDPSKTDLETAGRTWWVTGADNPSLLPAITIATIGSVAQQYRVHIKTLRFTQEAAMEDRWSFDFEFIVNSKV